MGLRSSKEPNGTVGYILSDNNLLTAEVLRHAIIDFPNLGLTYNGGWCLATETDETLITRPSCEVNVK